MPSPKRAIRCSRRLDYRQPIATRGTDGLIMVGIASVFLCAGTILHRMRTVHRRLRDADPHLTRVTDIAVQHGFYELGHFSVKYRQIFGESPSETLRGRRSVHLPA